ncbi:uncharacterized protein ACHE_70302S [Aspergillus chevalieri]|uniref:Uncharacterized protein n=1 Tax=Aspergillus chevalieri TaxID=182096 RepID=A0A7R7ZS93_ASPCH|nr:uncharacterized protein ACHE_70302S [Aspergillus chevalieri]BCR91459.1 hypothetical protein ACHE_70302S [Aspergillus chevalieri]
MLILRVTQDMPANTEITLAYKDPIPEFDEERTRFRSWNFFLRHQRQKREAIAASLEQTYARPPTFVPRVALFDIYLDLAHGYMRKQQPEKAVAAALKTFESLGFVIEGGELPHVPSTQLVVKRWGMFHSRPSAGLCLLVRIVCSSRRFARRRSSMRALRIKRLWGRMRRLRRRRIML